MLLTTEQLTQIMGLSLDLDKVKLTRAIDIAETIDLIGIIGKDNYARLFNDNDFYDKYYMPAPDYAHQGVQKGLAYMSYYRYLMQGNITSTASGEKVNNWLNSNEPDYRDKRKQMDDNLQLATTMLNTVAACMGGCIETKSNKIYLLD